MSGETKHDVSGWTVDTLFEHMSKEVDHVREIDRQRAKYNYRALKLQSKYLEGRLNDLNHAHAQRVQREAEFVKQETYDANKKADEEALKLALDRVTEKLEVIGTTLSGQAAVAEHSRISRGQWYAGLGAVCTVVVMVNIIILFLANAFK